MVGYMTMPANFRYKSVFLKGPPRHPELDAFRMKHPSMDYFKRAKIFAPFDALKGFNEAVASKEVLYENKRELDDETKEEIDYRLGILANLTRNSRMVRSNPTTISVTYYIPCGDKDNAAYGLRGRYAEVTGICRKVGRHDLTVGDQRIAFQDILAIQSDAIRDRWDEGPENDWGLEP